MSPEQTRWIMMTATSAYDAGHVYPRMAACEAALESSYGKSLLARVAFNFFGMKQHAHPTDGTINLPGEEFENGQFIPQKMAWVQYKSASACFTDRMETLKRLRNTYPEYDAALTATDPIAYVTAVSKRWSTDPERANKVIAIYNQVFGAPNNHDAVQQAATSES